MKKLISLILIVSMLVPACLVPVTAFAAKQTFLVAESYNDQPTGSMPLNGAVASGISKITVTAENKDKDVEMSGKVTDSVIYYPVTTDEHIASMYLDMLYTNGY